ncbi:ATP synthase F1 subunit delta [Candidatus Dependentiae bacterium]|nr:ATP synthase F1 subunit delta [Candidatus Dependentiae bacterium]
MSNINNVVAFNLSSRYTDSLINIGIKNNTVDEMYKNMKELRSIFGANNKKLVEIIKANSISETEKKSLLEVIFKNGNYLKEVKNLFYLILEKNREFLIDYIFKSFSHRYHILRNMINVYVESAVQLEDGVRNRIKDFLKKQTGKTILYNEKVNPDLVGGLVIKFGEKTLNCSLSRNIELMSKELLN